MTATISAKVVEVFPNGNLAVEGKREIYVNNEKKEILLQGIVRPGTLPVTTPFSQRRWRMPKSCLRA